ncbi:MAG: DUF2808 domain-containing protein [Gloeobacterales cyanobacterium]
MPISPISQAVKTFSGMALGVLCFSIGVCYTGSAWALQVGGESYFEHEPVLTRAYTNNVSATYSYARYSFEVNIPENSGEPLGGLTITIPHEIEIPRTEKIRVTDGIGQPIAFLMALQERTVQLTLSKPVSPGQKITVQFYPMSNPHLGGIFQFGISALPAGSKPHAQFLDFGQLTFYPSWW